jgi:hypothetical protein
MLRQSATPAPDKFVVGVRRRFTPGVVVELGTADSRGFLAYFPLCVGRDTGTATSVHEHETERKPAPAGQNWPQIRSIHAR